MEQHPRHFCWVHVFWICLGFWASGSSSVDDFRRAFPIDPGHTKLRLSSEGLDILERITTPIAAVAVIGPYRSAFLLNKLLSLCCYEGFGVGHMRDTKTKGIWIWGAPVELDINGVKTSVFYLVTEGFESVGKSNVYDDRIFSLATVLSSVLIYNLPETIREADISHLSFAVELAEEFYGRVKITKLRCSLSEGKSVQEMVDEALRHVPNTDGDSASLCQETRTSIKLIRLGNRCLSWAIIAQHLAYHRYSHIAPELFFLTATLQRTKLCDLKDYELDPAYIKKREQLKEVVSSVTSAKIMQGKLLNGKEFVSFLKQILEALNKGEIPSTGSLVEVFNKKILEQCLKKYSDMIGKVGLPLSEQALQYAHERSRQMSIKTFDDQHFGHHHAKRSAMQLEEEIEKVYKNVILANKYQSSKLCEGLYTKREDKMDQFQVLRLPSMAKFNAGFLQCYQSFEWKCVGPSKVNYEQCMMKMMSKSRSLFIKEYNHRLFNWLVAFSLVMVVIGRFVIKFIFIFLETYTRLFWSSETLYYNPVWHFIVATWETLVYNPVIDLDRWAIPIVLLGVLFLLYWRCYVRRKHCSRPLLPLYGTKRVARLDRGRIKEDNSSSSTPTYMPSSRPLGRARVFSMQSLPPARFFSFSGSQFENSCCTSKEEILIGKL